MKKLFSLTLLAMIVSFASFAQTLPIYGTAGCCVGSGSYLYDSTFGGTWSSSNVAIGTVDAVSGAVTGISAGVCTISYAAGGSVATYGYTVSPTPAAIVSATVVCVGASITATDAVSGGTWSTYTPTLMSISGAGVVTGILAGSGQIKYSMGTGCYALQSISVVGTPGAGLITGSTSVCVGSTIALADAAPGGVWTSSGSAATVSSTGVVTGVSTGSVNITYTVTGICGTAYAIHAVSVTSTVSAGTISGTATVVAGSSVTLTDGVSGGTWTSSNTAVATVGASTGIVHGVAAGSCTITYTVTGCGGTAYATYSFTVTAPPPVNMITGHVLFTGPAIDSFDTVKTWLIVYNTGTHMLEAVDSTYSFGGGTSAYYQYTTTAVTDSYRVKAAYFPATFSSTGYIPTYYTSDFYWHDATAFYHTAPSTDAGKDITMGYGTVTAGPGFIAGDVTTGANRGTSTTIPTVGLLVYVLNTAGVIMQHTYTDAAGHYTFSNLPVGVYTVYPEDMNYNTTAYTGINLTTTAPSFSAASFGQHTLSHTILPATTSVQNITSSISSVIAFPNPTNGKLNIQWNESASEKANVNITDITGRVVYSSAVDMNQGSGVSQLDLSGLTSGVYMISIKSGTINYNNKIELQK